MIDLAGVAEVVAMFSGYLSSGLVIVGGLGVLGFVAWATASLMRGR